MTELTKPTFLFLIELRKRLISCVIFLSIIFSGLTFFSNQLYASLALPLLKQLPMGSSLISINLFAPFFIPIELAFAASLFLSAPVFLYQGWKFVAPALYIEEKKFLALLLILSILLFYAGVCFAYFVLFPLLFHFLANTVPPGVTMNPDIGQYLNFSLRLFFVFGAVFEIPILVCVIVWSNLLTRQELVAWRRYVIVGSFIVSMLLGPPDVLSQILLALPIWFLYELGLFIGRFVKIKRHNRT